MCNNETGNDELKQEDLYIPQGIMQQKGPLWLSSHALMLLSRGRRHMFICLL